MVVFSFQFSFMERCLAVLIFSNRSSPPAMFLGKGVLKICSKFAGEHPCQSAISINLLCNFIEVPLQNGCSPVNLLDIFRTLLAKNTSEGLRLMLSYPDFYQSV